MENKSLSNLTVINIYRTTATAKEIDGLINSAIFSGIEKLNISSLGTLSTPNMSKSATLSPKVPFLPSVLIFSVTNEGKLVYLTPTSLTLTDQNLMSDKVVPKNVMKDIVPATTVPHWTSTQIRKPVDCYSFITVEELDIKIGQNFTAFIATAGKPQNYAQILQSPNQEEWEKVITTEFLNLQHVSVFK